jgi:hypothetical protein
MAWMFNEVKQFHGRERYPMHDQNEDIEMEQDEQSQPAPEPATVTEGASKPLVPSVRRVPAQVQAQPAVITKPVTELTPEQRVRQLERQVQDLYAKCRKKIAFFDRI